MKETPRIMRLFAGLGTVSGVLLAIGVAADAQNHRWIDSAGNIHFSESIENIPKRYRNQVVPPTPTVILSRQDMMRIQQEARRREMEMRRAEEMKKRDQARKQQEFEREAERRRREDERLRRIDEAKRQEEALRRGQREVIDTAE